MQISIVMLIVLLFSDQFFLGGEETASRGAPRERKPVRVDVIEADRFLCRLIV